MVRDIQPLVSYEGRLSLLSCPVVFGFCMVPSQQLHLLSSDNADRFLKRASAVVVRCQPWFYLRLVA